MKKLMPSLRKYKEAVHQNVLFKKARADDERKRLEDEAINNASRTPTPPGRPSAAERVASLPDNSSRARALGALQEMQDEEQRSGAA